MANKLYAVMNDNVVAELITLDAAININDAFAAEFAARLIDVTSVDPQPDVNWTFTTDGWAPPQPSEMTVENLLAYAAARRATVENAGVVLADGKKVKTDLASRMELWVSYVDAQANPGTHSYDLKLYDGTFKVCDAATSISYAVQVIQFLTLATNAEKTCYDGITAVPPTITNTFQIDTLFAQVHL